MQNVNAVAVVLASGSGERFGRTQTPKHLTPLLGAPTLVWTVNTVLKSKLFSAIVVVTSARNVKITEETLANYFHQIGLSIFITEGSTNRTQSFNLGFANLIERKLVDKSSIVALFDANRPFVTSVQLLELYKAMESHGCACPARPVVNGVATVSENKITSVPLKSDLMEFVTPEFIRLDKYDCQLENFLDGYACFVEFSLSFGLLPYVIEASDINTKLTYPEDRPFMEVLADQRNLLPPISIK